MLGSNQRPMPCKVRAFISCIRPTPLKQRSYDQTSLNQGSWLLGATSPSGIVCSALPFDLIQLLHILFREVGNEAKLAQLGEHDRVLLLSDYRQVWPAEARRDRIVSCLVGEPVAATVLPSAGGP